ncbi:ATP-binding protein [Brevundimonas sp.]|uniref:PAS domain-containing hybrid sensor histidine kinase/response regulator n=1 Tax=Brevundimonas sp. TaxID=1871086 RepID=UPI00286D4212|nr:ATP-binding protein [Brevundimonas sp.]
MDRSNAEAPLPDAIRPGLSLSPDELLWHLNRAQAVAQLGSWEWNISTGELRWSDEVFSLFGLPVDAFGASYSTFLDRIHPDDRGTVEETVRRAAEDSAAYELDYRILRPDGEIRFVHESGEVERDRAGGPLRMRGIVQDVTRSRAVERSATRNQDMLTGMFQISPEAIIVASQEGRVVIFSAGAEAVFGYAAHEIVGESIEWLMPERFRANHGELVARFSAGQRDSLQMAQRAPVHGLRKDGVEIPIKASLARIVAGGETLFTIIVRDLTERHQIEARLIEAREHAEQANRAKSEFLANMSHELRTPLNGILGVAESLAIDTAEPRKKEMVELIATSARALEALLTDILDLAQIEAGRMDIQHQPFDLETMVRSVSALFGASAMSKGLAFELDLPGEACARFMGDEKRLRQVLNNLLSNAVKFTDAGHVKLTLEVVEIVGSPGVRFAVEDTGIGFDNAAKVRLFNRFEQADGSITRRFGGTGLGLSICKVLVELMGGTIRVESRPGEGATFIFEVPLALAGMVSASPEQGATFVVASAERRLRILLAEDHPANRRVVEFMLEPLGVDLLSVENGELAVAEAAAGSFDLILMDMQMPVMDGLEAIRRIRERERDEGLDRARICMLTANALPQFKGIAEEAGADDFLTKPISAQALIGRVLAVGSVTEVPSGPILKG